MAEKSPAQLHELLKEDQEPFHLKTYIANKQSQLKTSSNTSLSLRKRRPVFHDTPTKRHNLCKHACFLSLAAASPFPSPAKSPCKSPNAAVFLHIPSRTASILVEAAMRIQKQNRSKPKPPQRTGFGLLGSFLKRIKNRKRAIHDSDVTAAQQENRTGDETETVGISPCSCSSAAVDLEASTSSRVDDEICADFCLSDDDDDSCFCASPFRFSLHQSPSSAGRRTPEFFSPPPSPTRRGMQEKENENVQGEEEEEKEQCSPVSVLDPLFDEDDEHESARADEEDDEEEEDDDDDYDMECSYENVQRAKQQLLHRLRRFEKLAELDPVELEKKLLMEEGQVEREEPLSADMKRLVSDLIVEEKVQSGGSEVVMGRICNRLDSWKEVEFDTIDMMIGLDFKKEIDGSWTKCGQQVQETAAEIEGGIYLVLIQELTEELFI